MMDDGNSNTCEPPWPATDFSFSFFAEKLLADEEGADVVAGLMIL